MQRFEQLSYHVMVQEGGRAENHTHHIPWLDSQKKRVLERAGSSQSRLTRMSYQTLERLERLRNVVALGEQCARNSFKKGRKKGSNVGVLTLFFDA